MLSHYFFLMALTYCCCAQQRPRLPSSYQIEMLYHYADGRPDKYFSTVVYDDRFQFQQGTKRMLNDLIECSLEGINIVAEGSPMNLQEWYYCKKNGTSNVHHGWYVASRHKRFLLS